MGKGAVAVPTPASPRKIKTDRENRHFPVGWGISENRLYCVAKVFSPE
jgi:hypothetical protein